jgi:putative Holliday junction resolvase
MGRILALDYGTRRIGLAISDETKTIAQLLPPVVRQEPKEIWEKLKQIVKQKQIEKIVLGLPVGLQGQDTAATKETRQFRAELSKIFSKIKVELIDERFSTRQAKFMLQSQGMSRKKCRSLIDSMSAYVILESYLLAKREKWPPEADISERATQTKGLIPRASGRERGPGAPPPGSKTLYLRKLKS